MTVVRADTMGLCMGVKRALRIVEKALAENPDTPIYTLGPLIHNPRVVEEFRRKGVAAVEDLSRVQRGIVVIRAHGIGPELRGQCEREGLTCIDATCPNVRRIHRNVAAHAARGFHVIIVGDEEHGEVKGIRGYAGSYAVISSVSEAETTPIPGPCIVVGQTTFKREEYLGICEALKARAPVIEVLDTLCAATESRQESLLRLAEQVDALLVVGGKKSANTRWLHQAALGTGKPSWHIEEASDIPREIAGFARVGISAGASTPDTTIDEVEAALLELGTRFSAGQV